MTDLAAKLAELASKWRRTPALLAADAAADDLATFVDDNLAAILTALRASRPEPAADAVEAVARAIAGTYDNEPWDELDDAEREGFRESARVALSALPRPAADDGAVVAAARALRDHEKAGPEQDCWDGDGEEPPEDAERWSSDWAHRAYHEKRVALVNQLDAALAAAQEPDHA